MGQWEAYEDPENYQTRLYLAGSLGAVVQEQRQNKLQIGRKKMRNCRQHTTTQNLRGIDR